MGLSARKKGMYALGQFGLVLSAYGTGKLFVAFFVDRGFSNTPIFPAFISQKYLLGLFTIAGLILALTRLVDAAVGLFSGFLSDRSRLKKGRRTGIMSLSVVPLAFFSLLVFFPPINGVSSLNGIFLLVCMILFYVFLSLYTIPYLALLSEYGNNSRDRMKISALMACSTAFASLLGDRITWFMDQCSARYGFSNLVSFRLIIVVYAIVSCLCMMVPAFLLNERKYTKAEPVTDSFSAAFGAVFRDSCFRPYLIADVMYRIAFAFAAAGFSYYVTGLLGLPLSVTVFYLLFIFFANLILYFPVYFIVRRIGKRKMLFIAFLMLMAFLTAAVFAGKYPVPAFIQGTILSILVAIPASVFTVVPNVIVAELAVASEKKSGVQRGGMYFGVHSLVIKAGQMFATLLFPTIISFGIKPSGGVNRMGLRVTLIIAAVFSLVGFLSLFGYREKEVAALLEKKD